MVIFSTRIRCYKFVADVFDFDPDIPTQISKHNSCVKSIEKVTGFEKVNFLCVSIFLGELLASLS